MTGQHPPVAKCKACDESIIWCLSDKGKRMPVDLEPAEQGNLELSGPVPRAVVRSKNGRPPGLKLYVSHWKTCPKVQDFRKRQDAQREQQQTRSADQGALFGGGGR